MSIEATAPATETPSPAAPAPAKAVKKVANKRPAKPAAKAVRPVATAPEPVARRPVVKKAAKAAVKPAQKSAKAVASKPAASQADAAKVAPRRAQKIKMVRDSFTFPESEHKRLVEMKKRLIALGAEVKKGELVRAGLALLAKLDDKQLIQAAAGIEKIKTGRPKK